MYDPYFKSVVPRCYRLYSTLAHSYFQIIWDEKYNSRSYLGHSVWAILKHANVNLNQFLRKRYIKVPYKCHNERIIANDIQHNYTPSYWRKNMKNVIYHMHLHKLNAFKYALYVYRQGVNTGFLHKDSSTLTKIHQLKLVNHPPRIQLRALGLHKRYSFTATYTKCGFKKSLSHFKPTMLLTNIIYNCPNGSRQHITDHVWINYTKTLAKLGTLEQGDKLCFNARVHTYPKRKHMDYNLAYLSQIRVIHNTHMPFKLPTGKGYQAILVGRAMAYMHIYRGIASFYRRLYSDWVDKQRISTMTGIKKLIYLLGFKLRMQLRYDHSHNVKYVYNMKQSPCQYDFFSYLQKHPKLKRMLKIRKTYKLSRFTGIDTKQPVSHHDLFERVNAKIMNGSSVHISKLKQLQNKFNN